MNHFNMVDVGSKATTHRKARAQGQIIMSPKAFLSLKKGENPKGDVLALAEVAGIMAAKKTSDFIPLCHPLPLDQVRIQFELNENTSSVTAYCEVSTHAKTGVEMEALSGVNGALLSIYDLCKAVDPVLSIQNVRLNVKEGGKSGIWVHPDHVKTPAQIDLEGVLSAVITVSDRVSQGVAVDTSGPEIISFLQSAKSTVCFTQTVPDDKEQIQKAIFRAIREQEARLVITTGGTGLGPRDVTPEAIEAICDRKIPGFGESLRTEGARQISSAWLSRSLGATLGQSILIALPGSQKAVKEGIAVLSSYLSHAMHVLRGGRHD